MVQILQWVSLQLETILVHIFFLYNLERSPLQQSAGTGVIPGAGNDPFATTPQQRMFYQNLFIQLDKDKEHKVKHDEVITYHSQSGLPKEVLER